MKSHLSRSVPCLAVLASLLIPIEARAEGTSVRGEVIDSATGKPIPCRIYIEGEDGTWHFPKSEAKAGSAVEYRKQRPGQPAVGRDAHHALGPPVRRHAPAGQVHVHRRTRQGVPARDAGGDGRQGPGRSAIQAAALDRHGRPRLVLGRHARASLGGGAAEPRAGRGPQRRVPAVVLGDRGVRVAEDGPQRPVPGGRPEAHRGRSARTSSTRSTPSTRSSPSGRSGTRSGRSSPSTTRPCSTPACRR